MFNNVGAKVKGLAKFICIMGMIVSVLSGLMMIVSGFNAYRGGETLIVSGIVTGVVGCLASWIGSWVTYAIGEAAEYAEKNGCR